MSLARESHRRIPSFRHSVKDHLAAALGLRRCRKEIKLVCPEDLDDLFKADQHRRQIIADLLGGLRNGVTKTISALEDQILHRLRAPFVNDGMIITRVIGRRFRFGRNLSLARARKNRGQGEVRMLQL